METVENLRKEQQQGSLRNSLRSSIRTSLRSGYSTHGKDSLCIVSLVEGRGAARGDIGVCYFNLRSAECILSQVLFYFLFSIINFDVILLSF